MKILLVENKQRTFLPIKEVLETLDGVEVCPKNESENTNMIDVINHHNSNRNTYEKVLSDNPDIDLFIIDIYLSNQNKRDKNGIIFCEYILEKIRKKEYEKNSNFIIISSGYIEPYEIPFGDNIQFINKYEQGAFLYEVLRMKVKEIMDIGS